MAIMSKAMEVQNGNRMGAPDQSDRVEVEECVPASPPKPAKYILSALLPGSNGFLGSASVALGQMLWAR